MNTPIRIVAALGVASALLAGPAQAAGSGLYLGVGAEAFVNPGEFVDFILGWFGADISSDDEYAPAVETVKA